MTMGTLDRPRVAPSRVVIVLLVLDVLVFVPLGLVLVWLGAVAPEPHWNDLARVGAVALGLAGITMSTVVGLGIVRYNVLGIPQVRLGPDGVTIGEARTGWGQIGRVGIQVLYDVPYLTIELDPTALGRVPWIDRISMKLAAPPDHRRGPLWITEQQLGIRARAALDLVPPDHLGR